jgi:hypothetical protein
MLSLRDDADHDIAGDDEENIQQSKRSQNVETAREHRVYDFRPYRMMEYSVLQNGCPTKKSR